MHKQNTVMLLYLDIYTYQMIFILIRCFLVRVHKLPRFPNRSATLCGDSQAVKTMKNTAEVCHAAGGAKPPKSWLLHKG